MITKADMFLRYFSQKEKDNVVELCKRVSRSNAKVYMVMARKAACFFDCLRSLEIFDPSGYVTTERVMDMNVDWLIRMGSVCIIDDTIISGTTIYRTLERLREIGVKDISVHALSINSKWFDSSLIGDLEFPLKRPYAIQEDGECAKQCKNIISAISIFPRPYDIDFPYSTNLKITQGKGNKLLANPYWETHEVSSPIQRSQSIRSLVLLPKQAMHAKFGDFFHGSSWMSHFKIRLYCTMSEDGKHFKAIRIVPITILRDLSALDCNSLFESTLKSLGCDNAQKDALNNEFITPSSRYRFLQFIISKHIGELWAEQCSEILGHRFYYEINQQSLELIFSPTVCPLLSKLMLSKQCYPIMIQSDVKPKVKPNNFKPPAEKVNDAATIVNNLIYPFLWLYHKREIPTRTLVKEKGIRIIKALPHPLKERLFLGFTFDELTEKCIPKQDDICRESIVSLFLDVAIDEGMVVPVCGVTEDNVYFRGFRHGEDVIFGDEEFKMLFLVYESFLKETEQNYLSSFLVHKLAVILFQTGTIFTRPALLRSLRTHREWTEARRTIPDFSAARVKCYLQGPVVILERNIPSPDYDRCYLSTNSCTSWLNKESTRSKIGILKEMRKTTKTTYSLGECPKITLPREKERYASSLGSLIGHLAKTKSPKDGKSILNLDKDLVTLTTCLDVRCALAALGADAAIVCECWEKDMNLIMQALKQLSPIDLKALMNFRKTYTWNAINAARTKFYIVLSGQALYLFDRIRNHLTTRDLALWDTYWQVDEIVKPSNCDKHYWNAYESIGFWAVSLKAYLSALFLCSAMMSKEPKESYVAKYSEEILDCEKILQLRRDRGKILPIIQLSKQLISDRNASKANEIFKRIAENLPSMKRWVQPKIEYADYLVQDFGRTPESAEHFSYALFITIEVPSEAVDVTSYRTKLSRMLTDYIINSRPQCIARLLPDRLVPSPFDIAVICTGNRINDFICSVINHIYEKCLSGFVVRCLELAQLAKEDRIHSRPDGTDSYWMDGFIENLNDCLSVAEYKSSGCLVTMCYPKYEKSRSEFGKLLALSSSFSLKQRYEVRLSPLHAAPYVVESVTFNRKEIHPMVTKNTIISAPVTNSNITSNSTDVSQSIVINPDLNNVLTRIMEAAAGNDNISKKEYVSVQEDISNLRQELQKTRPSKNNVDTIMGRLGSIASIASLVNNIIPFLPVLF